MSSDHLLHEGCDEDREVGTGQLFLDYLSQNIPSAEDMSGRDLVLVRTTYETPKLPGVTIERNFVCILPIYADTSPKLIKGLDQSNFIYLAEIKCNSIRLIFETHSSGIVYRFFNMIEEVINKFNETTGSDVKFENVPLCWLSV